MPGGYGSSIGSLIFPSENVEIYIESLEPQNSDPCSPKCKERLQMQMALEEQLKPFKGKCSFVLIGVAFDKNCASIALISEQAIAYGIDLQYEEFRQYKRYRERLLLPLEEKPFFLPLQNLLISEEEIQERQNIAAFYRDIGSYIDITELTTEDYNDLVQGLAELEKAKFEEFGGLAFGATGGVSNVTQKAAKAAPVAKFFDKFKTKLGIKAKVTPLKKVGNIISAKKLQAKFKHAGDFGVVGNYSKANAEKFSAAIEQHINSAEVQAIQGTYKGQSVIHYLNPTTGVNIISTPSGQFISGWKLGLEQLQGILKDGTLW